MPIHQSYLLCECETSHYKYHSNVSHRGTIKNTWPEPIYKKSFPELVLRGIEPGIHLYNEFDLIKSRKNP